jgi:hypothetical protein
MLRNMTERAGFSTAFVGISTGGPGDVSHVLIEHLGDGAESLPAVSAMWPAYEHVNVQGGVDRWLAACRVF